MKTTKQPTVGIAVLTLNSAKLLPSSLPPLLSSPLKPRVLVVDSSSSDDTVGVAFKLGADTIVIDRADFNHGLTRELARKHLNTDIVVMVTPDAIAENNQVLATLIQPIIEGRSAAAYARQIPHKGAGFFEAFPREYNYPAVSHIRGIEDLPKYGIYTYFCSDSFAAYSNKALDEIGGFQMVLLGEDTLAVAQLLRKQYKIAYVAEAVVNHSHRYSLMQEFRRYFDTGLARTEYQQWISCSNDSESKRGSDFVKAMIVKLMKKRPLLLPYAFFQTLTKWLGYRIGTKCHKAPIWLKKYLSSHPTYWTSNPFLKKGPLRNSE